MASASTVSLPNLYQGVEKESFGYKLLANLGWKEGQGLVRARLGAARVSELLLPGWCSRWPSPAVLLADTLHVVAAMLRVQINRVLRST